MAGHSKWANIKHKKAKEDKKRGKLFTKLIREITISARLGGPDSGSNPRLRAAIDAALAGNMPRDTIDRAIKRGAGDADSDNVEEIIYEGYGPGGVAVMVFCLSDNRNRTVSSVRHAFTKCGGNLGTDGSVAYLFTRRGLILFPNTVSEEQVLEAALEAGAEDVITSDDGSIEVYTAWEQLAEVKAAMEAEGLTPESAEVSMIASTDVELDQEGAEKMIRLIDMLEDLDDVQDVYSNASISDDILATLA